MPGMSLWRWLCHRAPRSLPRVQGWAGWQDVAWFGYKLGGGRVPPRLRVGTWYRVGGGSGSVVVPHQPAERRNRFSFPARDGGRGGPVLLEVWGRVGDVGQGGSRAPWRWQRKDLVFLLLWGQRWRGNWDLPPAATSHLPPSSTLVPPRRGASPSSPPPTCQQRHSVTERMPPNVPHQPFWDTRCHGAHSAIPPVPGARMQPAGTPHLNRHRPRRGAELHPTPKTKTGERQSSTSIIFRYEKTF